MARIFFNDGGLGPPARRKRGGHRLPLPTAPPPSVQQVPDPARSTRRPRPRPVPAPTQNGQPPLWELTPAAAARKCDSSAWRHLNPVVLVRPDWKRCHSPRHIAQCLLIFAALDFGGVVALGIFAEVVLAIGDVGSRFAATTIDPSWLVWTLLLLVYAPLGEEAMCRWPIAQRPRAFLLLPGVYIAVAGITGFPDAAQYLGAGILLDAVAIAVGLGLHLLSGRVRVLAAIDQRVDRWLLRWPAVPVWLMISCFALAHLARYEIDWSVTAILVIPVVVLPWLWFGALASIVRIRFGWWSAVMLHAAVNLVVLLIDVVFGLLALL